MRAGARDLGVGQVGEERAPTNVAQLCWNQSIVSFAAWSRGARWFGAGLLESDGDTTIFLMAFVGRVGDEDAPTA